MAALLQQFQGDVTHACRCWGELVETLNVSHVENEERHPVNKIHACDDVEKALRSTLPLCVCAEEGLDIWIEFVWIVEARRGQARDDDARRPGTVVFRQIHRGRALKDECVTEAEHAAYPPRTPFTDAVRTTAVVVIQASAFRRLPALSAQALLGTTAASGVDVLDLIPELHDDMRTRPLPGRRRVACLQVPLR